MLDEILVRLFSGGGITIEEALDLNNCCSTDDLCDAADKVRAHFHGDSLDTCSIVNARSGRCSEDCKWCSQSRYHSTGINEYESISSDGLMAAAAANDRRGVRRLSLVTSGRKVSPADIGHFCEMYRMLRQCTSMSLCASMGLLGRDGLQALYDAGVRRYHCNLETSSEYFPSLCSTHSHADKLRTIAMAREVGMEVCSGGIIGMGESMRDRLLMVREAVDAGAVSVPVNILNPISGTPLAGMPPLSVMRFAGGRARLSHETTERILRGGMNGAMIGDLLTTVGNKVDEDYALFDRIGYKY